VIRLRYHDGMNSAPVFVDSAGNRSAILWDKTQPSILLPGAFNPLHDAHLTLAALAERLENRPAVFELSVANVDKPELTDVEVQRRLEQFLGKAPVWITRAPLFTEKAELFPGAIFAIGADTAARLVEPRYYGSGQAIETALEQIAARNCRFLVAGRRDAAGRFLGLQDITIPVRYRDMFREIPEGDFRMDISSTVLRSSRGSDDFADSAKRARNDESERL
jgi:hypothetical protein